MVLFLGDQGLFTTTQTLNELTVSLTNPLTENDVEGRSYFMTILTATKPNVGKGSTVLLVNIPVTTPRPAIEIPAFQKTLYRGTINPTDYTLTVEDVVLTPSTYSSVVSFELVGGM